MIVLAVTTQAGIRSAVRAGRTLQTNLTNTASPPYKEQMARMVNLYEAKTQLSELVERAAAGEEIVIAKSGRPRARLVPLRADRPKRKPGAWKGRMRIADDFDAPLPPEILRAFLGG